eukprot:gene8-410_t
MKEDAFTAIQTFFGAKLTTVTRPASHGMATIRSLLKHPRVNVNAKGHNGLTPYMLAAEEGKVEVMQLLRDHPALDTEIKLN